MFRETKENGAVFVTMPKLWVERLLAVARAADRFAMSNDPGDELWDALDVLQPGDLEPFDEVQS